MLERNVTGALFSPIFFVCIGSRQCCVYRFVVSLSFAVFVSTEFPLCERRQCSIRSFKTRNPDQDPRLRTVVRSFELLATPMLSVQIGMIWRISRHICSSA
jgi:hypothetical protein